MSQPLQLPSGVSPYTSSKPNIFGSPTFLSDTPENTYSYISPKTGRAMILTPYHGKYGIADISVADRESGEVISFVEQTVKEGVDTILSDEKNSSNTKKSDYLFFKVEGGGVIRFRADNVDIDPATNAITKVIDASRKKIKSIIPEITGKMVSYQRGKNMPIEREVIGLDENGNVMLKNLENNKVLKITPKTYFEKVTCMQSEEVIEAEKNRIEGAIYYFRGLLDNVQNLTLDLSHN